MQVIEQLYYTPEKYLQLEEAADYKSEYIDGQIIPMAGGSTNHNQIALNLSTELNFAFKKQNYRVFMDDVVKLARLLRFIAIQKSHIT